MGITLKFEGEGINELAIIEKIDGDKAPALTPGKVIMRVDPRYFRPTEVDTLLGDPTEAKNKLGWVPKISAQEMCKEMVAEDYKEVQRNTLLKDNGFDVNVSTE